MLELGKLGSAGVPKGDAGAPRRRRSSRLLRASNWKEAAFAVVGDREWVFAKRRGELTGALGGRSGRTRALPRPATSFWRATWTVDLDGHGWSRCESASLWRGTHRFVVDGAEIAVSGSTGGWGRGRR